MAQAVRFPFPLGGLDENWAYQNQPKQTTPDCLNVRAYSVDEERARGGRRPGLNRKLSVSGRVQWLGEFNVGFGSSYFYEDEFDYTGNQTLKSVSDTKWASASTSLEHYNNTVICGGTCTAAASGAHGDIQATDKWTDFKMEASISWRTPTNWTVSLYSGENANGSGGVLAAVGHDYEYKGFPKNGYYLTETIAASNRRKTMELGAGTVSGSGTLRVEGDQSNIDVFWDTGSNVSTMSIPRGAGGTCTTAGFKVSMGNPRPGSIPTDFLKVSVDNWYHWGYRAAVNVTKKLAVIAGDNLLYGTVSSLADKGDVGGSTDPMAAAVGGLLFITNGNEPKVYDPIADAVTTMGARKGEIVDSAVLCCNYRNRLVFSGDLDNPNNWWMSRQDDPYDWDYGHDDAKSAVAGSVSIQGSIRDPVTALCPITENRLIFGCTRSLWEMRGDPQAGGILSCVSQEVGIVDRYAWTLDPSGNFYFVGTEGFYVLPPGGKPQNLSSRRIPSLSDIDPEDYYVVCAYDAERHGVLIFLTPNWAATATHYFYDLRNNAFFPEQYAGSADPSAAAVFYDEDPTNRKLYLGGKSGGLFFFNDAADQDVVGGTAYDISSYVWLGPMRLAGDLHDARIIRTSGTLSSGSANVTYGLYAADTMEGVTSATVSREGLWSAGRNIDDRARVRGGAHGIKLTGSSSSAWAMEGVVCEASPAGRLRL